MIRQGQYVVVHTVILDNDKRLAVCRSAYILNNNKTLAVCRAYISENNKPLAVCCSAYLSINDKTLALCSSAYTLNVSHSSCKTDNHSDSIYAVRMYVCQ